MFNLITLALQSIPHISAHSGGDNGPNGTKTKQSAISVTQYVRLLICLLQDLHFLGNVSRVLILNMQNVLIESN